MKKIIACICIALAAFAAGHSAIVTSFGQEHFYGINGYEIG